MLEINYYSPGNPQGEGKGKGGNGVY